METFLAGVKDFDVYWQVARANGTVYRVGGAIEQTKRDMYAKVAAVQSLLALYIHTYIHKSFIKTMTKRIDFTVKTTRIPAKARFGRPYTAP